MEKGDGEVKRHESIALMAREYIRLLAYRIAEIEAKKLDKAAEAKQIRDLFYCAMTELREEGFAVSESIRMNNQNSRLDFSRVGQLGEGVTNG
jgi:hypothetical protein